MASIDLAGKTICITGASSGIGRATAMECARSGMNIVASARREDRLRDLVQEARRLGARAEMIVGDVADPSSGRELIEKAFEAFGGVYAVFANAGYGVEAPIHEMSDEDLRAIFETNFFGTLHSLKPAIPHMIEQGAGHALICSSCVSKFALPYYGAYSATKAAQNHIGRAMRLELERFGVYVSTVHPVGTRTEFFDEAKKRSRRAALVEHSKDLFMQPAEKVARAVVRCLRKPKPEVWTSQAVRLGMAMAMPIPRLSDLFLRSQLRRRLELDEQHRSAEQGSVDRAPNAPISDPR